MTDQATPPGSAGATDHRRPSLPLAFAVLALGAGALVTGCGDARDASADADAASGEAEPIVRPLVQGKDGIAVPALDPDDPNKIIPVVGERRLSPSAIPIDPDQLLPEDLPITEEDRALIVDLVEHMQPLHESLTSDHHDRQYHDQLAKMERLLASDRPEVGWAALHAFTNYPGKHVNIRRSLLQVGAEVSPENARELLRTLAFTYGFALADRAEAVELYGKVDPEDYFEKARPYLERKGKPFQTAPQDEFFVRGWLNACEASGTSPAPMMAQVATNFALGDYARHKAVEVLQDHADDPLARGALEAILVESTGNGYIRRKAAQSILAGYSREEACVLLETVFGRETDLNFMRFLDDMIQSNCR